MKKKIILTERELINKIERAVLNEQGFGFECEAGTCQCVPTGIIPPGGPTYPTIAACQAAHNCCSGNSGQQWYCEQTPGSTPPCGCIQGIVPTGVQGYQTQQDCQLDQNSCCYSGGQPQWWCIGGVAGMSCVQSPNQPGPNSSGPFVTQQDCMQSPNCATPQPWACVNGNCVPSPNGQYVTQADCLTACSTPLTWKCKNKGSHPKFGKHCVQVPSGGDFATKQQCQASKGCAQLHNKGYQVDMDIDVLNKKGSIVDYTPDGSSTSSYGKETTKLRESDLINIIRRVVNEEAGNPKEMSPPELFSARGGRGTKKKAMAKQTMAPPTSSSPACPPINLNSPFYTNNPEFCLFSNGVYIHQQPGMSYYNHPDGVCC